MNFGWVEPDAMILRMEALEHVDLCLFFGIIEQRKGFSEQNHIFPAQA
jgi:hypothetical protein